MQRLALTVVLLLTQLTLCQLSAQRVVLVAGGGHLPPDASVPAREAQLKEPFGIAFDAEGSLFILEMAEGSRLLQLDKAGRMTRVAGTGTNGLGGDGGPVSQAQFNGPHNLAITPAGIILIADTWNGRVRQLDRKTNKASTLPGFGVASDQGRAAGPYCVTLDFEGSNLYIADLHRVQALDLRSGQLRVVAGNGQQGIPRDGALAREAPLVDPRAAAVDRQGNVYILERGGHALRVVDREGRIRTVVNTSGKRGNSGDGGPAAQATLNGPKHLCIDPEDNVIIADAENNLIRKYVPREERIYRVAGTGEKGAEGIGGPPERVQLARPHGVTIGPDNQLYVVDSYNHRILRIEP